MPTPWQRLGDDIARLISLIPERELLERWDEVLENMRAEEAAQMMTAMIPMNWIDANSPLAPLHDLAAHGPGKGGDHGSRRET